MSSRRLFLLLAATLLLSTGCFPTFTGPTPDPAVQTRLAEIDANNGRPVGRYGVFLTSLDGETVEQIYGGNRLRNNLRVSPDGAWILYVEYTADQNDDGIANEGDVKSAEIGIMRLDGSEVQLLTDNDTVDLAPSWAPGGEQIIFSSDRDNEEYMLDLFIMDIDGGNVRNITQTPDLVETDASWVGEHIVMIRQQPDAKTQGLWVMTCDIENVEACGDDVQQLTNPSFETESEVGYIFGDFDPKISPDGETVLFYRHSDEAWSLGNLPVGDWDIYTIPVTGGEPTLLSQNDRADVMPVWSPDGSQVAFWVLSDDFEDLGDIFVMDADGGSRTKIEGEYDLHYAQMPEWVPAGAIDGTVGNATNGANGDSEAPWILFTAEWIDGGRATAE